MGSKGSAPKTPDYGALIPAQGGEDRKSLQYTLDQMRVNQTSPYGTQSWQKQGGTFDEAGYNAALAKYNSLSPHEKQLSAPPSRDYYTSAPQWTYNQTLSPEQQRLYDADVGSKLQQSELLSGAAQRVGGSLGQGLDTSGLPQRSGQLSPTGMPSPMDASRFQSPQAQSAGRLGPGQLQGVGAVGSAGSGFDAGRQNSVAEALYNQQMRFLQPEQDRSSERLRGQLIQSGFQEGSEGYTNERNRLEQQQGMMRADARDRAIMASGQEDSRRFGQDMASSQYLQGLAGAQDASDVNRFQANLGAGGQDFAQQLAAGGFDRDTMSQIWQQGLAGSQLGFNQQLQAGQFNDQQRDAALREQMMLRQLPLNELNALRTGAQVTLPNNPAQYGSPQLASGDLIGAADKTYQGQLNAYNAQQQSQNALMGGLFGLGGAFLGNPSLFKG